MDTYLKLKILLMLTVVMKKMLNLDIRERNLMGKRSREYIKDKFEINLVNNSILEVIYKHI
jgi:hypothetical protein